MKIIKQRTTISIIIILLLFILLLLRLFYIQIFNNELYIDRAYDLWTRNIVVNSRRGNIYDRNGELIVGNKLAPTISIIPSQIKDKDFAASVIAEALGYEVSEIIYHFNKNVSVEIIKPEALKLTEEQAKEYANNVYKKLENYVITNNIGEQDKNDTSLPINLIPASSDNTIYPNLDSWYYIKNKQVFAYIAIDTKDQTYGWCYNGGIDNYKEGEC